MSKSKLGALALAMGLGLVSAQPARAVYWNVFNIEEEASLASGIVTYATLTDMLHDVNRIDVVIPNGGGVAKNVVDSDSDGTTYWNLFNIENESGLASGFVTYATLADMLSDVNRIDVVIPNGGGVSKNVVGSGSDGKIYWNVFNIEEEASLASGIVTYATLTDMLHDVNRIDVVIPNGGGVAKNVVDSGSDGTIYWNIFNIEEEASLASGIVTYATLADMLSDVNRIDVVIPNGGGVAKNVIGGGSNAFPVAPPPPAVPEPASWAMMIFGLASIGGVLRMRHASRLVLGSLGRPTHFD